MPGNDFDDASLALATCVHHSLLGHIAAGRPWGETRAVRRAAAHACAGDPGRRRDFSRIRPESQRINDPAWRQKLADAIAEGVQSYQGVADHKEPPKLLADYRSEQMPLPGAIVNPAHVGGRVRQPPADRRSAR